MSEKWDCLKNEHSRNPVPRRLQRAAEKEKMALATFEQDLMAKNSAVNKLVANSNAYYRKKLGNTKTCPFDAADYLGTDRWRCKEVDFSHEGFKNLKIWGTKHDFEMLEIAPSIGMDGNYALPKGAADELKEGSNYQLFCIMQAGMKFAFRFRKAVAFASH